MIPTEINDCKRKKDRLHIALLWWRVLIEWEKNVQKLNTLGFFLHTHKVRFYFIMRIRNLRVQLISMHSRNINFLVDIYYV